MTVESGTSAGRMARLGHASATETLHTYPHLWPDSGERTREAVDAVLGVGRVADHLRPKRPL